MKKTLALISGLTFAASLANAKTEEAPTPEGWLTRATLGYIHQTDADLDQGGDLGRDIAAIEASILYNQRDYGYQASIQYVNSSYDFDGSSGWALVDPWDDINSWTLDFGGNWSMDENWRLFANAGINSTYESGADFDDGLTLSGLLGGMYHYSDTLSIGPGIIVSEELEDGTDILPILFINWQIAENWKLATSSGFGATQGPGLKLSYQTDSDFEVFAGLRSESMRFRLDREGIAPHGVAEDEYYRFAIGVDYRPSQAIQLQALIGYGFGGELKLDDANGNRIAKEDYDGSVILGLAGRIYFAP